MGLFDDFGFNRSEYPKNYFPNLAWKLNNTASVGDHEIMIDVDLINVDIICFIQLIEESSCNKEIMANIISNQVQERGKFHNGITGTSGTLCGKVVEIGSLYSNKLGLEVGDRVVTLVSLSGVPLQITEILDINTEYAQISVKGKAIVYENTSLYKFRKKSESPLKISALENIGEMTRTSKLVKPGMNVLVLGASSKMGLLCAFAARSTLGSKGKLHGVVSDKSHLPTELANCFDEIMSIELTNEEFSNFQLSKANYYDIIINCSNLAHIEPACVIMAKDGGSIFFAGWRNSSDYAGIAAESLSKDIDMIFYSGYTEGQAAFFDSLYEAHSEILEKIVAIGLKNDLKHTWQKIYKSQQNILDASIVGKKSNDSYIFASWESQQLLEELMKIAAFDCNVLITGESGTGKEIAASIIHNNSDRKDNRFIKINCASIPENLLESELFGYEQGSFTGANPKGKKGLWEQANNGTLLLDEIGDLPLPFQAKLLRAIDENEIYRVGGVNPIKTNVRVLCATNRNLKQMVKNQLFRNDLYYRLCVFTIQMPPLRERADDIGPLADMFISKYNKKYSMCKFITDEAKEYIKSLPWHGNIRELDNFIQRLFVSTVNHEISVFDVSRLYDYENKDFALEKIEDKSQDTIIQLSNEEMEERNKLIEYKRKYKTTRKMAEALGRSQSSIVRRLHKYHIT